MFEDYSDSELMSVMILLCKKAQLSISTDTLDDALQLLSEQLLDLAKLVRYEQRKETRHRP